MASDPNYPEADTSNTASPAAASPDAAPDDTSGDSEPDTALVPKTLLGSDIKVGATVSMKVVHIYEDEVELAMADEAKEETSEGSTPDQQLEGMASGGGGGGMGGGGMGGGGMTGG